MFKLGNFSVKELITGVAQSFNDELLYNLDQLTKASIEISAESTEVKDKNGNVIRVIYKSKTGKVTANSALLSPVLMAAQSGTAMKYASTESAIEMPKIIIVAAGTVVDASDAIEGTIHVMGLYGNGANGAVLAQGTSAVLNKTFGFDTASKKITLPNATGEDAPQKYLITYKRDNTKGAVIVNKVDEFPDTVKLTFYAAVMDPCADKYKAAYIVIPSFQTDPSVTINMDAESTETDFNGNINTDYCGVDKVLYYIYFPDEDAVTTVVSE